MRRSNRTGMMPILVCLAAVCWGCQNGDDPGKSNGESETLTPESSSVKEPKVPSNLPPPAPSIPDVNLLEKDREKCEVFVGDPMPEGELPDPDGNLHPLGELYGKKVTVVCFWTSGEPPFGPASATMLLEDLNREYAQPYAEQGLKVISINRRDTQEVVSQRAQEAGATYSTLLDSDGAFFAKVASEKLPRIYVLDADGKIRWFDVEYSESTREQLSQAVRALLEEGL